MENDIRKIKANLQDPEVLVIVEKFGAVLVDGEAGGDVGIARTMVALVLTCTSACKSYGINPVEFIRNFGMVYDRTVPATVPVAPIGDGGPE